MSPPKYYQTLTMSSVLDKSLAFTLLLPPMRSLKASDCESGQFGKMAFKKWPARYARWINVSLGVRWPATWGGADARQVRARSLRARVSPDWPSTFPCFLLPNPALHQILLNNVWHLSHQPFSGQEPPHMADCSKQGHRIIPIQRWFLLRSQKCDMSLKHQESTYPSPALSQ